MTSNRRVGRRAPLTGVIAVLTALLLLPASVHAADWTTLKRVSPIGGTRLDSLHQMTAARGTMHLVHPRIGPNRTDDRIVYQRSTNDGASWSREKPLFTSTSKRRHVAPNLAIDASGGVVAVAFRVNGPDEHALFVRVSRDGGDTFGLRQDVFNTQHKDGIGVPAVAVGDDFIAVAWTNRANGRIKLRVSRDDGRTFKDARTLGTTRLSIDCRKKLSDGLVGLAASDRMLHVAWSHAPKRSCQAAAIRIRTSLDRGNKWSPKRTITRRRSYGWPELDARGKTVVATVQSPTGGLIVARSGRKGRNWNDRLMKPGRGHSYSAGDIVLLPNRKALVTYVDERIRKNKLVSTKLVSKRSPDDARTWKSTKTIASAAKRLRMAPNIAANGADAAVVVQAGPLDGSPRNIFVSRLD